jgi:cobalt/nickel transport system permease protein
MNCSIDHLAYTNRLRWLPPGHKLLFTLALLLLSLVAHPVVQILICLWLVLWIVVYAHIPAHVYLKLLLIPLLFWLTSAPALIVNGVNPQALASVQFDIWQSWELDVGNVHWYISRTGLHQVSLLFARTLSTTSSLYFLLLTTPLAEVLQILRKLRCPDLLLELLLLMYRFIFTILTIATDLRIAQKSRGGYRTYQRSLYSLSLLTGQLLERTLYSYRQVSLSLTARGFTGELRVWHSQTYQSSRRYNLEAVTGYVSLIVVSIFYH